MKTRRFLGKIKKAIFRPLLLEFFIDSSGSYHTFNFGMSEHKILNFTVNGNIHGNDPQN